MTSLKYKASFCKKKGTNNGYYCDKEGENGHIEEEDVTSWLWALSAYFKIRTSYII